MSVTDKLDALAKVPHVLRDWWLAPERVAEESGRWFPRVILSCPECGDVAEDDRGNRWRCKAFEQVGGVKVAVCDARGRVVNGELLVTQGSNNLWRDYV